MFGYYDPASLKIAGRHAVISFIDVSAGNVTEVSIDSAADARRIAGSLRTQKQNGISTLTGELVEITGSLVMTSQAGDEGLIIPDGDRGAIPVMLSFEVEPDALPRNSYAKVLGTMIDGALVAVKLAMKSLIPAMEPRPAQGQQLA